MMSNETAKTQTISAAAVMPEPKNEQVPVEAPKACKEPKTDYVLSTWVDGGSKEYLEITRAEYEHLKRCLALDKGLISSEDMNVLEDAAEAAA